MHASHLCFHLKGENFSLSLCPDVLRSCTSTFLSVFPFSSPHLLCCCSISSPLFVLLTPHLLLLLIPASLFALSLVSAGPSNHCFNHPRVPLLQDGSCNGLQHYAALGRDVIGATSVNLMPCEVPQDVYSGVAQQVSRAGLFLSFGVFSGAKVDFKTFQRNRRAVNRALLPESTTAQSCK